jgi:hypothetical protein
MCPSQGFTAGHRRGNRVVATAQSMCRLALAASACGTNRPIEMKGTRTRSLRASRRAMARRTQPGHDLSMRGTTPRTTGGCRTGGRRRDLLDPDQWLGRPFRPGTTDDDGIIFSYCREGRARRSVGISALSMPEQSPTCARAPEGSANSAGLRPAVPLRQSRNGLLEDRSR